MNILNEFFNKIYVVTSYSTKNRLSELLSFLDVEKIDYELIVAPKKKYFRDYDDQNTWIGKGNFSLLSVNESILLKEYYIKSNSFCILEDDILFDISYKQKLKNVVEVLPSDWQILNLGYHAHSSILIENNDIFKKLKVGEYFVGTHIVGYKSNVVESLLDKIDKNTHPIDAFINNNISELNIYTSLDKIFYASSFRENEIDKSEFYKKYKSEISS